MTEMAESGYPSDEELETLRTFHGTPREFVEYMGSIWRNGSGWSLKKGRDEFLQRTVWVVTFITGGWSGCEEIISVVQETFFSILFHSMWKRGGLWEYRISSALIDSEMDLGLLERQPEVGPTDDEKKGFISPTA
jgi:hypothetical protein